ncbi:hypothetical protein SYNPS1DRAFT_21175 [Syncephalis pseudoplumigaleata]|uniref:Uncharacterized protein n=1 Tax=Syncephalis pseudoplumigaleata TaxID=1712513 RepID=A0A4P9Z6F5_9FUNG|nr:hypothetical protein SYNPS1DRAFT_21175 [Syncephalis pseudoplumigaleata]|eukprot:RKP27250.1 hypothetical protein SYNPS1DRAFT_21175 [Syncephalis pseudoplumigaleata]
MAGESAPSFVLRGHEAQVTSLAFDDAGTRLYSGDVDGVVLAWDLRTRRPIRHMQVHAGGVRTAPPQLLVQLAVNDTGFCRAALLHLPEMACSDAVDVPRWLVAAPAVSDPSKDAVD